MPPAKAAWLKADFFLGLTPRLAHMRQPKED